MRRRPPKPNWLAYLRLLWAQHRAQTRLLCLTLRAELVSPVAGTEEQRADSVWHLATQIRVYRVLAHDAARMYHDELARVRAERRAARERAETMRAIRRAWEDP